MRLHFLLFISFSVLEAADPGGVRVSLDGHEGAAVVKAELLEKFTLRLEVDPKGESKPVAIRVELPKSGPLTWPAADVEVRDDSGAALLVERSGIEWGNLLIPLPPGVHSCIVQAVEPDSGWPKTLPEKARTIPDNPSGVTVRVANWLDGRAAALSIRFDDSHSTHLSKAVPILREYGFRATFMVNPGPGEPGSRRSYSFEKERAGWEAMIKEGNHELANHSAHHRGAKGDEDMDAEIGTAAQVIWKLTPGRSKLMALNLGGGTRWETTRTLRYYLDKYFQFDASSGSLGMDDSYGGRLAAFRTSLEQHIARGLWCRIHYHYLGDGLSSSEANFRAALDIAKEHADSLWIAGLADIHKYQSERNAAKLTLISSDAQSLVFQLDCGTDGTLYDQALTLEAARDQSGEALSIQAIDEKGRMLPQRVARVDGVPVLRFDVPPVRGVYRIELKR